jgi:hypothetical protein
LKTLIKNNFITGFLAGMVFPALAWLFFGYLFKDAVIMNKPEIPYFVAIALNLIFLKFAFNKNLHKSAMGIMVITFIFMLYMLKIQAAR